MDRYRFCVAKNNFVAKSVNSSLYNDRQVQVIQLGTVVEISAVCTKEKICNFRLKNEETELSDGRVLISTKCNFIPLLHDLWQAFMGIPSRLDRVRMADDRSLCDELVKVGVGMVVSLLPDREKSDEQPIESVVRYKGPVPEIGSGHYFGLEILGNAQGNCDGSLRGKKYFMCQKYKGIFVPLNRILPSDIKQTPGGMSTYSGAVKFREIFTDLNFTYESFSSMPSNDCKRYNARKPDCSKYKTTLVLQLREDRKPSMSRPLKADNREKLLGLESNSHANNVGDSFLKIGDKVVWVSDSGPEVGTVRWIGDCTEENLANMVVGVEFENPVGDGSGSYNNQKHFETDPLHGAFLPLLELMKADDFFSKPQEPSKPKASVPAATENVNTSRIPSLGNSRKLALNICSSDVGSKGHVPEPHMWNNSVSELSDVFSSVSKDKQSNEGKLSKNRCDNLCKSEYVFSEGSGYINSIKIDNNEKNCFKEPKNNNVNKKTIVINQAEAAPVIGASEETLRRGDHIPKPVKPNELKIKHSHSRDIHPRNSDVMDALEETWMPSDLTYSTNNLRDDAIMSRADLLKFCKTIQVKDAASVIGASEETLRRVDHVPKPVKPNGLKIKDSHSKDIHQRNNDVIDSLEETWIPDIGSAYSKNNVRDDTIMSRADLSKFCKTIPVKESDVDCERDCNAALLLNDFSEHTLSKRSSPTNDVTAFLDDSERSVVPADLEVGSVVEVRVNLKPHYGVIRWIGTIEEDKKRRKIAGIEMEEDHIGYSDGSFNGRRYFHCRPKKAMFVTLNSCQKDGRFQEQQLAVDSKIKSFGQIDCPVIPGVVPPIRWNGDTESFCGKFRGIQGHHNSCYLDATLFSMFTFTSVFDSLLFRPPTQNDIQQYGEVQRVLREEIVNPLRQNLYVRADRVMKLRTLLENLSSVTGLTSEEKDPEEFLTSLIAQILKAEPFLKLSSGQEAYHYQLFVEKDEQLVLPSVQQLFEQSFLTSDIKLKEVPSCLIIQMPRFGKSFKMYPRILPSQLLDITDIIEDSPRQCTVCGKLAEYECRECFGHFGSGLDSIAFCEECLGTAHSHQRRNNHGYRKLSVPVEFSVLKEHCHIPRLYMELFAVVCIETSHYVAFVKCGSGSEAPWCFFDSMADRKGEQNGYNIPEMVLCPRLPYWLSDDGTHSLQEIKDDRLLPEHAKRLLCDAYMCMYQSPDVMMYR